MNIETNSIIEHLIGVIIALALGAIAHNLKRIADHLVGEKKG